MANTPTLVVVSGPPGSGKTSLAHALAKEIPCPAVCRDEIKEGMVHACGGEFEAAAGDPLTQRTLPLFFDVLRVLLEGGVTVVAEAAFQDRLWRSGLEPLSQVGRLRVVHCHVDAAVAYERYQRRLAAGGRKAHGTIIGTEPEDWEGAYESFDRVNVQAASIEVDTTDGYSPDLPELVAFVNRD
ncbi:MAG TPA: AAA family ATPase [Gaiellaceae bacterium]|nr:AAA family ATPase [Gaiellaceae bacterium]